MTTVRLGSPENLVALPLLEQTIRNNADQSQGQVPPPRLYRSRRVDELTNQLSQAPAAALSLLTLRQNLGTTHGIAMIPGYDAAIPTEQEALFETGQRASLQLSGVDFALLGEENPARTEPCLG